VSVLELRLLGGFVVSEDGAPLSSLHGSRQQALLAWLLLHPGEPQPRARLASLLWPDGGEVQARNNFRKLLFDVREDWPTVDTFVDIGRMTIAWRRSASYSLDVDAFTAAVDMAASSELIRDAASLYGGILLPECYDDWTIPFRDDLHRAFVGLLERGIQSAESERDYGPAMDYAKRLLQEEPLREDVYLSLMRLHALSGDRAGSLRMYHLCSSILDQELGVAPGREIEELYQRLLDDPTGAGPAKPTAERRTTALIGRDKEWQVIQGAWIAARDGKPTVVAITGEPGIGKTRLAQEMSDWVQRQGLAVAGASCYAGEETLPFAAITRLLGSPSIQAGLRSLQPAWLREISGLIPELAQVGSAVVEPAQSGGLPAGRPRQGWQRRVLLDAIAHALLAAQPVLLTIDDLQWCDPNSLFALEQLVKSTDRVLVLVTARPGLNQGDRPLLQDDRLQSQIVQVELDPLDRGQSAQLAAALDPDGPTWAIEIDDLEALYQQTEGNPLYIVELVRAGWVDSGDRASLPGSLQAAVRGHFANLPDGARKLLELAATIGREFRLSVLAHASGQDGATLVRNLDQLWRRRIVRENGTDGYDFCHGRLREVAYHDLSNADRALLHRRVAEAYQETRPVGVGIADIARHFELAGALAQAARFYEQAANAARDIYANQAAVSYYRRAIALLPPDRGIEVMVQLGEILKIAGEWTEAEHVYREALASAFRKDDMAVVSRCRAGIGDVLRLRGQFAEALEWLDEAREGFDGSGDLPALVGVTGLIAQTNLALADYGEAAACAKRQLALAEKLRDPRQKAAALVNLGTASLRRTRFVEALGYYRRGLRIQEQLNNREGIQLAMGWLGNAHRLKGDLSLAVDHFQRQHSLAQEIGNLHGEAVASGNLGIVYEELGEYDTAATWDQKALAIHRRLGNRHGEGVTTCNLAVLHHDRGEHVLAWEGFREALAILHEVGDRRNEAVTLGDLAAVYRDLGCFDEAMRCYAVSVLMSLEIGNPQNITICAGSMGEALRAQNRAPEAETYTVQAIALGRRFQMLYWLCRDLHTLAKLRAQQCLYQQAITLNDEALQLATQSRRRDILFQASLLRVTICAAAGQRSLIDSLEELQRLKEACAQGPRREADLAAIQYEIWRLDKGQQEARRAAITLTRRLYERTPLAQYAEWLVELGAPGPEPVDALPDPPSLVDEWQPDLDAIPALLNEFAAGLPTTSA
jgi:DNA-binding SARP family transcriptional activator/tetratricopeptide (TPR) repeat protein